MTLGFADTVDKAVEDYWARAAQVVRFTIEESGRRLIKRSPVGMPETWKRKAPADYRPGQFRSNWRLAKDVIDHGYDDLTSIHEVRNLDVLDGSPFGHRFYISNPLPYAFRLEIDRWSKQVPEGGMVRLTGLEFDQIFRWAVDEAKAVTGPREMHRGGYGR